MESIIAIIRNKTVQCLVICIFFMLFNWPVLTSIYQKSASFVFVYFFSVWALLIGWIGLWAYIHSYYQAPNEKKRRRSAREDF